MGVAGLLDGWRLAEGWTAGDRFRQQVEHDPTWHDENVFLALEGDRVVGTLTTLPRHLQILGHVVPAGGISNLYTEPGARGRGIATELLEHAGAEMRARGLELALAFPGAPPATPEFFGRRGWFAWGGQQTILRRDPDATPRDGDGAADEFEIEPVTAQDERALQSVKSIHAAYAASRSGTMVRDDALWAASVRHTLQPREEFWIARRGGLTVAYARAAIVDDVLTITELGRFEDGADALARLIGSLLMPRDEDPLSPSGTGGRRSECAAPILRSAPDLRRHRPDGCARASWRAFPSDGGDPCLLRMREPDRFRVAAGCGPACGRGRRRVPAEDPAAGRDGLLAFRSLLVPLPAPRGANEHERGDALESA